MQIFPLSHYALWKMGLKVTLEIFLFFAEGGVAVFSACLKLRIQKVNDYYYRLPLGPNTGSETTGPRQQ